MGRARRAIHGNQVYHVLNRANGRACIFAKPEDYQAFERILHEAVSRFSMRLCCYCLMPNHWHLALWPRQGQAKDFSSFMQWLTLTHTQRWHAHNQSAGEGHLYQGRFKSFPAHGDAHLLKMFRYIEQNALRANLVKRVQDWPYCSLWHREHATADDKPWLADWPIRIPRDWDQMVNFIPDAVELDALRLAVRRGRPFGSTEWVQSAAASLGLQATMRPQGRPRKSVHTNGHK